MSYNTLDATFKLSLEESGVLTTCDIASLFSEDFEETMSGLFSDFRSTQEVAQMIVQSEVLKEGIMELVEISGATTVRLVVTGVGKAGLHLSTEGTMGVCEIDLPASSDAFVSFKCGETYNWEYSLGSLQLGMKALTVATETYIRINSDGIMCIQHQLETSRGQDTYIDFLMLSADDISGQDSVSQMNDLEVISGATRPNLGGDGDDDDDFGMGEFS
jgi:Repair protein Rad1/Rec1/Rad17